jgi:hypothetical protein
MSDDISVYDRSGLAGDNGCVDLEEAPLGLGTNGDTGVVLTWSGVTPTGAACPETQRMAITTRTSASVVNAPEIPGQVQPIMPDVQMQDGTFIGLAVDDTSTVYMVAFDQAGGVKWSLPNYYPLIATADGGLIATDNWVSATIFDQNGNATGQIANMPTYSWKGAYLDGDLDWVIAALDLASIISTTSFAAVPGGNLAGNGFSLAHHTFGLWYCGPEGDGACAPNGLAGTPVAFSYLQDSLLNAQNYTQAVDFSGARAHPDWVTAIRNEAAKSYWKAFEHVAAVLPIASNAQWRATPPFEHTNYVLGVWPDGSPTGMTPLRYCGAGGIEGICPFSWVYYPVIMDNAQGALMSSNWVHLSPPYPPTTSADFTQFGQLVTGIGHAIGTIAAHETGHQLSVPNMDCTTNSTENKDNTCPEDYLYQQDASGTSQEWFYEDIPNKRIHWTSRAECFIQYYLLNGRWARGDGKCP